MPVDSLIWDIIDIQTAEYKGGPHDESVMQLIADNQCASVASTSRVHYTNARFQVGCGAIAAYAWLRDHGRLTSAWNQTKMEDANRVARSASILRLPSFKTRAQITVSPRALTPKYNIPIN